jgi:hypothetical protein
MGVTITFLSGGQQGPTPSGSALPPDSLVVDGVLRQGHERRNEVTKHPVEEGADITDNIRPEPVVVVIEGIISATPLSGAQDEDNPNRHIAAFDRLTKAVKERELIQIATGLAIYPKMAIESFSAPRDPKTGVDLYFTITAREVVFAVTQTTTVPKDALGAKGAPPAAVASTQRKAAPATNKGPKPTTPVTAAQKPQVDRVRAQVKPKPQPRKDTWAVQTIRSTVKLVTGQ